MADPEERSGEALKLYFEFFKHFTTIATAVGILVVALHREMGMASASVFIALISLGLALAVSIFGMLTMVAKASGEFGAQEPGRGTWVLAGTTALMFLTGLVVSFMHFGG